MDLPQENTPQPSRIDGWKAWLSKPENMVTGAVLMASLLQPREQGRNGLQTLAQRGMGALAFRGALEQSIGDNRQKDLEAQSQRDYRAGTLANQAEQNQVGRERITAETESSRLAREAQIRAAEISRQAIPKTPEELDLLKAQASAEYAQGRYYDNAGKAALTNAQGKTNLNDLLKLPYEEEMFKGWKESKLALGQPFDLNEWEKTIQPLRAANLHMRAQVSQGISPEIVQEADGSLFIKVRGVGAPRQVPGGGAPNNPQPAVAAPEPTDPVARARASIAANKDRAYKAQARDKAQRDAREAFYRDYQNLSNEELVAIRTDPKAEPYHRAAAADVLTTRSIKATSNRY